MDRLKNPFGYGMSLIVILGGVLLLTHEKGHFVLLLNENHGRILDVFFRYITFLGDGLIIVPLFVGTFIYRYYHGIVTLITGGFVLLFSQGLKKTIFSGWPRPTAYFDVPVEFNFVENVEVHSYNTFPSGHTMTAFAVFFLLALVVQRKNMYVLFFLISCLVGMSRVYLLQHFFVDIYFGSILGILSVLLGIFVTDKIIGDKNLVLFRNRSIIER